MDFQLVSFQSRYTSFCFRSEMPLLAVKYLFVSKHFLACYFSSCSLESAGSGEASTGVEMYKVICPLEPCKGTTSGRHTLYDDVILIFFSVIFAQSWRPNMCFYFLSSGLVGIRIERAKTTSVEKENSMVIGKTKKSGHVNQANKK